MRWIIQMSRQSEITYLKIALGREEKVRRLEISVKNLSRMEVVQTFEQLISNKLFMNFLEVTLVYSPIQVSCHVLKHQVNVPPWNRRHNLVKFNDVRMIHFFENWDLSVSSLSIGIMLKSLEDLLQSIKLVGFIVRRHLPNMSVRPWAELLDDLVFVLDMLVDLLVVSHQRIIIMHLINAFQYYILSIEMSQETSDPNGAKNIEDYSHSHPY
jgi:hypothetical protein